MNYAYAGYELPLLDPSSTVYAAPAATNNSFPWLPQGVSAQLAGPSSSSFGRKKKKRKSKNKKRKHVGYVVKKRRVVKVYTFEGLKGKRFSNRNITKSKVYKTESAAKKSIKPLRRKRRNSSSSSSKREYYYVYGNNGRVYGASSSLGLDSYVRAQYLNRLLNPATTTSTGTQTTSSAGTQTTSSGSFGNRRYKSPAVGFNYKINQYAVNEGTPTLNAMTRIGQRAAYSYPSRKRNETFFSNSTNVSGMGF